MTKEDFAPDKIGEFLYAEHPEDIITIGSYARFHGVIPDFEPHDYDYLIMMKSDHNEIMRYHYMFCDYWVVYFREGETVDEFIKYIIDLTSTWASIVYILINKNRSTYFDIQYSDLEPYLDVIEEKITICSNVIPKMLYVKKIFEYIVMNKSLDLTEEQIKDVYEVYKENHDKGERKYIERRPITQENNE